MCDGSLIFGSVLSHRVEIGGTTSIILLDSALNLTDTYVGVIVIMQAEVNFLGQLHHGNLVKLIGYCSEDDQRLLVYEFMPRGSLENHLFRSKLMLFSHLSSMLKVIENLCKSSFDVYIRNWTSSVSLWILWLVSYVNLGLRLVHFVWLLDTHLTFSHTLRTPPSKIYLLESIRDYIIICVIAERVKGRARNCISFVREIHL